MPLSGWCFPMLWRVVTASTRRSCVTSLPLAQSCQRVEGVDVSLGYGEVFGEVLPLRVLVVVAERASSGLDLIAGDVPFPPGRAHSWSTLATVSECMPVSLPNTFGPSPWARHQTPFQRGPAKRSEMPLTARASGDLYRRVGTRLVSPRW